MIQARTVGARLRHCAPTPHAALAALSPTASHRGDVMHRVGPCSTTVPPGIAAYSHCKATHSQLDVGQFERALAFCRERGSHYANLSREPRRIRRTFVFELENICRLEPLLRPSGQAPTLQQQLWRGVVRDGRSMLSRAMEGRGSGQSADAAYHPGFKKAIDRTTTTVMIKTGHVDKTTDRDYEVEER